MALFNKAKEYENKIVYLPTTIEVTVNRVKNNYKFNTIHACLAEIEKAFAALHEFKRSIIFIKNTSSASEPPKQS